MANPYFCIWYRGRIEFLAALARAPSSKRCSLSSAVQFTGRRREQSRAVRSRASSSIIRSHPSLLRTHGIIVCSYHRRVLFRKHPAARSAADFAILFRSRRAFVSSSLVRVHRALPALSQSHSFRLKNDVSWSVARHARTKRFSFRRVSPYLSAEPAFLRKLLFQPASFTLFGSDRHHVSVELSL